MYRRPRVFNQTVCPVLPAWFAAHYQAPAQDEKLADTSVRQVKAPQAWPDRVGQRPTDIGA